MTRPHQPATAPSLPDQVDFQSAADPLPRIGPQPPLAPVFPRFRALAQGCYFLQWRPTSNFFFRYNGTMRIERHSSGVTASGDLYQHAAFRFVGFPRFRLVPNPDPNPGDGIPIFARAGYRYYLRVTQVLEFLTVSDRFTLGFERFSFDQSTNAWSNDGTFSAEMVFKSAPAGYPSGATYLEGDLKDPGGAVIGTLSMGLVSPFLRKAVLEVDRVSQSEYPASNGSGIDWQDVYDPVGWDVNVYESDTNLSEPSGESWSDAEMHASMLARRDSADLDRTWRYHLLCIRRLDSTDRGIMYDAYGGDSNNIPREGAGISSHWMIPDTPTWGNVRGQRFGAAPAPYFRTAVHEIGHAMGLYHNTADNGFMNTTNVIAASPGTFPDNVRWAFNEPDQKRLRHFPDPWVRPGVIPFGGPYGGVPISPTDAVEPPEGVRLEVAPLKESVPIGAPVRIHVTLRNDTETPIHAPRSLSLKSEHVTGVVVDPSGTRRDFRSLVRCIEEEETEELAAGAQTSHDLTLLRGHDGALFPGPGMHKVVVELAWSIDGVPIRATAETSVMITSPVDEEHASAALAALDSPDLLLVVALGGDHLDSGLAALDRALSNPVLRPHYQVIEAKRRGRRFGKRKATPEALADLIDKQTVMSPSEIRRVAGIIESAKADQRKSKSMQGVVDALADCAKKTKASADVRDQVKRLSA